MALKSIREAGDLGGRWAPLAPSLVRLVVSLTLVVLGHAAAGTGILASTVSVAILLGGFSLVEWKQNRAGPFGLPNHVTWVRLSATAYLAGLTAAVWGHADAGTAWLVVAVAIVAAALDGVDGWLARRYGPDTLFGARFDMETDALLILVLALFAVATGKVGAWILLSGLIRYLFVAFAIPFPWLAVPLPPSLRRKAVCVVQIGALIVMAAPVLDASAAAAVGALSLSALVWSFAVDVLWLARHRGNG